VTDVALTGFEEGPHTLQYAPKLLFALKHVMDVTIKFIRAGGVDRGCVYLLLSLSARKDNDRFARVERDRWAVGQRISGKTERS